MLFPASASLAQSLSNNKISIGDAAFLFGIAFIGGGIVTHITSHFIKKMNKNRVNKIVVGIIATLTMVSSICMIINTILSFNTFGSEYMVNIQDFC